MRLGLSKSSWLEVWIRKDKVDTVVGDVLSALLVCSLSLFVVGVCFGKTM